MIGTEAALDKQNSATISGYRKLPDRLLELAGARGFAILAVLLKLSRGDRWVWASNDTIGRQAGGIGARSVQLHLTRLEGLGLVRRTTATRQEAGKTHRLIELLDPCFVVPPEATQKVGRAAKETGPCNAQEFAPRKNLRPKDYEGVGSNGVSATPEASSAPDGAVADALPSKTKPKPRRQGEPHEPADQARILDEMKGLEAAVLEAIAEERRDDQPLDRSVLLNGSMPRTKAALNAYAHRVAAVLDNPTGWTTFRRYLAGDFAEGGAAPSGFRTSLGDVLRNWHNGIVETTPARYFTGMLSGAERWRLVQSPPPGWVRPEVWGYSRENTWKNNNNGDELAMRWVSEDNRRGMFYSLTDGRIYEFDLPRQTDGNGQQTRQQARKGR